MVRNMVNDLFSTQYHKEPASVSAVGLGFQSPGQAERLARLFEDTLHSSHQDPDLNELSSEKTSGAEQNRDTLGYQTDNFEAGGFEIAVQDDEFTITYSQAGTEVYFPETLEAILPGVNSVTIPDQWLDKQSAIPIALENLQDAVSTPYSDGYTIQVETNLVYLFSEAYSLAIEVFSQNLNLSTQQTLSLLKRSLNEEEIDRTKLANAIELELFKQGGSRFLEDPNSAKFIASMINLFDHLQHQTLVPFVTLLNRDSIVFDDRNKSAYHHHVGSNNAHLQASYSESLAASQQFIHPEELGFRAHFNLW